MALVVSARPGGDVAMEDADPTMCLARLIQNENEILVDALPYLDREYDNPTIRDRVDSLVEAEMGNFKPRDYLGSLPPVPPVSLPKESLLWKEFERIKADPSSKLGGIDLAKYEPAAPSGKEAKDPKAWKEALDRAHTALEHTNIRSGNAELLNLHGVNAWRAYNIGLEDVNEVHKKRLTMEQAKVTAINRKRQHLQLGSAAKLQKLEDKYVTAVHKNRRIEGQCQALEAEIAALEAKAGADKK